MSKPRSAMVDRFRAVLLNRIRDSEKLLVQLAEGGGSEEVLREVMGQLHTLKGESKMLGLTSLSRAAHQVEEHLLAAGPHDGEAMATTARALLETMARMAKALDEGLSAEQRDLLLQGLDGDGAPTTPAPEKPAIRPRQRERWTQVSAPLLDELCEKVEDFSAAFRLLQSQLAGWPRATASDYRAMLEEFERCRVTLDDFTGIAWGLRLVSVEPMLEELSEHVRALARSSGKSIQVTAQTSGAQLERDVLDRVWDALLHVMHNAIDHGIEPPEERGDKPKQGTIAVTAESSGPTVLFTISDDGRGIIVERVRRAAVERGLVQAVDAQSLSDTETIELLFQHGFSTRTVTSETSGRGVGLDVVRSRVESLGGSVAVETTPKIGTRFLLRVPAAMTRERMMVLEMGGGLYGIPSRAVRSTVRLVDSRVETVSTGRVIYHEEGVLPLRSLAACLNVTGDPEETLALILELSGRLWATSVTRILGERDLVRRTLDAPAGAIQSIGASALLDDGRLVLILQLEHLVHNLRASARGQLVHRSDRPAKRSEEGRRRQRVLVVDDSLVVCELVSEILASEGLDVHVEHDGAAALAAIEAAQPDMILSDVEMPRMDGFSLLEAVRQTKGRLPFVLLTTRGSPEDRRRATALGADAYLIKSDFESGILVETVRRFVDPNA